MNSDPNSTYAIWAGDPTAADAPFRVERDGSVIATDGQIGGWNLGDKLLYSGTDADSTYVGLDSDPNHTYAIWAGDETAADAPFRVARDGTVYLTKLKAVDEQGHTTNVNLTNYPFWKLNTNFLRSASVSGNQLTLTYFNGDTVNFSKANAYDHATVGFGEEVYGGFRAEITLYNDNNEVIITPSVTATEHNDGHYITVIAVADGESAQTRLDLQRWYNEGWTNAYNQIVTPN